jgi:two-component system sensor histidine kinase RpfC
MRRAPSRRHLAPLGVLRQRLATREDTEHEQALIRIGIIGLVLIWGMLGPVPHPPPEWRLPTIEQLAGFFLVVSLLHFAWVVAEPRVHDRRRSAFLVVDNAAIASAMASGGAGTALLYPLLLWVTLGHGFRYGPQHLIGSAVLSMVMFGALVLFHPYWSSLGVLNVGLFLGLILIPGYCYRLLRVLHDARRRAEASNNAKSRFLATVSHELRTPLHAILGMTDLMRDTPLRPDQRDMARTIYLAGHGLLNMIEDILDIARIEAGADRVDLEDTDLPRQLHAIREMLNHKAVEKGIELRIRIDPALPPLVHGPRRAIHQILVNLVANAIKFTDAGHVAFGVETVAGDRDAAWIALVVTDTGCGLSAAAQQRVFESFTQADDTTTRRHGGSGLGLAIVKHLVETAGGTLDLESAVGVGTRFTIALPVRALPDPALPPNAHVAVHGAPDPVLDAHLRALDVGRVDGDTPTATPSGHIVDLWCCGSRPTPPAFRHGRDLVVVGARSALPLAALAGLPEAPDRGQLARALRAALVTALDETADAGAVRVHAGSRSLDVLVADDNRVNQQVIERLLTRAGHRAVVVGDGQAALERASAQNFDVLVLDLNMPRLGGSGVAQRLRDRRPRPRLVALTADATPGARTASEAAGFDAFVTKPVDGARLLATIATDVAAAGVATAASAAPAAVEAAEAATAEAATAEAATAEVATAPASSPAATPAEPAAVAADTADPDPDDVIDASRLTLLRELDHDDGFLDDVIDTFIADGEGLVEEIVAAAEAGDLATLRDRAHALRSAATHLGAVRLFEACIAVKSLDADDPSMRAPQAGARIRAAFDAARRTLRRLRAGGYAA